MGEPTMLFVTGADVVTPRGGRPLLTALHFAVLTELLGSRLVLHSLPPARALAVQSLNGYIDGVSPAAIAKIVGRITAERIRHVWLDGSNLGNLARGIRRHCPGTKVLTFCHNVEARFFLGSFRHNPRVHAFAVMAANYLAERRAVLASDRLIALSERDSRGFERLYGRAATDILPMAVADQTGAAEHGIAVAADAPLIFVGGAFYANRAGVEWFARAVAPRLSLQTKVIGHGMDSLSDELGATPNVQVVGAVDHLEPHYRAARAAIAPIFDGSGMKTKVAEALMFGRPIIGTPEAFSGYENVAAAAGWVCRTADEFVAAVADAKRRPLPTFDPALRELYDQNYSAAATSRRLLDILKSVGLTP